jgi:dipeptidyl aminopeptidase/acylaminoacyl peptidase
VAFICHGKLFVAEELNPKAKSAKVRLLANIGMVPKESLPQGCPDDYKYAEPVLVPRWSPDGALIAFLRPAPPPGVANQVCVVNVSTGKETVLAQDAPNDDLIWEQPWSSDSCSLAYSYLRPCDDGKGGTSEGINIVSIAGGASRRVVVGGMAVYPSWSPRGDLLVYSGPSERSGLGNMIPSIYTCGIDGKNPLPIAKVTSSKADLAAAQKQMRDRLLDAIKHNYPNAYSADEIKELVNGNISDSDVIAVIMIAEGKKEAKEIGGEFKQKVDAALKRWPVRGKHKFGASVDISKAVDSLPDDKNRAFQDKIRNVIMDVTRPSMGLKSTFDITPTWSPDGKKLAFTRWDISAGYMRLIVADVLTGKVRTVFESSVVGNVTWTKDSKSLVLSAKRNLAYKGKLDKADNPWPELITMPSYPEIWIIDLK